MTIDEIVEFSKKDKFWYSQADAYLQSCLGFEYGFAKSYEIYPVFIKLFIFALEGHNHAYEAVGINDALEPSKYFLKLWTKDKKYFQNIEKKWRKVEKVQEKIVQNLEKTNLKKISDQKLLDVYTQLQNASITIWAYLGLPEVIGIFEQDIFPNKVLHKLKVTEKEYLEIASVLATVSQESFMTKFDKELGTLKKRQAQGKDIKLTLKNLIKKYYWIRTGYHNIQNLREKEILEELKGYKQSETQNLPSRQVIIKKFKIPSNIIKTFDFIALMAYWRDERKRISLPAIYWTFKICDEVARRRKINRKLVYNLDYQEMRKFIKDSADIPSRTRKQEKLTFTISKEGINYFYGKNHLKIFQSYFGHKKLDDSSLTGMMTSRAGEGKIQGKVRVVLNPKNSFFEKGEILIAPQTQPSYLPLMKKAKAIVTDQGGITSHAAIISREFGIPCLVGTRFATKILKNGDIIEINTNHGTVKRLS